MAETPYRWTVDVETDFGGRSNGIAGLRSGLSRILEAFREAEIKALFFISTETLAYMENLVEKIRYDRHEIGSHGHFHQKFNQLWRAQVDKEFSQKILGSRHATSRLYRAPKFYWNRQDSIYSDPKNHVSLLKHMWLGSPIKEETIIYLHPFDITEHRGDYPDLFCRVWYSRPKKAYKLFKELVTKYK